MILDSVIFLCIPLIQLGTSYYFSIASLLCILVIYKLRSAIIPSLTEGSTGKIFVFVLMFASLLSFPSADLGQGILRVAREGTIFLFLTSILERLSKDPGTIDLTRVRWLGLCLISILMIITIVQSVLLERGIYFGIPLEYFATDGSTLPDELALIYSKLRPPGTFQEPSYFGFILISLFLIFCKDSISNRKSMVIVALIIITGLMTKSLSFYLSIAILAYIAYAGSQSTSTKIFASIGVGCVVIGWYFFIGSSDVLDRLDPATGAGYDGSISDRILGPAAILADFLFQYPVGVSFYSLSTALYDYSKASGSTPEALLNNGVYNLFFFYGLVAIFILFVLVKSVNDSISRIYLILTGIFNGDFFSIDKFAIICITLSIYEYSKQSTTARKIAIQPDGMVAKRLQ